MENYTKNSKIYIQNWNIFPNMDEKDGKILKLLKENSKLTTNQISKKILMPITTVHNRIKKLEKEGIIEGYTVKLNNKKIGRSIAAYIMITVDYNLLQQLKMVQHDLIKKIKLNEYVEETAIITGVSDIIIKLRVKDIDKLNEFVTVYLRNIKGVENTQTAVVLNEA